MATRSCVTGSGPGVITPTQVIVDAGAPGAARDAAVQAAVDRLGDRLFEDFELVGLASGPKPPYVDPTGRYARVIAAGVSEYGAPSTQRVRRAATERVHPRSPLPGRHAGLRRGRPGGGRRLPLPRVRRVSLARAPRARAHLRRPAPRLSLAAAAAEGRRPQPAHGRGRLRDPGRRLPLGDRSARSSGCSRATRSRGGFPSSSSPSSSVSRWTTRSSSSRGCVSRGTTCPTTPAPWRTGSNGPGGSSPRPR